MKRFGRLFVAGFLAILCVAVTPYYVSFVYNFPDPIPFAGDHFYNPYASDDTILLKGNFHAHTHTHSGLTEGAVTPKILLDKYKDLGYNVPAVSNYNEIMPDSGWQEIYVPDFEHGMNIAFNHQLVINARKSMWFDYPIWPTRSNKQHMLNWLKDSSNYVAYAHPNFLHRMSVDEFTYYSNYDMMEIISPRANSFDHWDAALSAGHAIWGLSNDDAHDTINHECGVCWNMIRAPEKSQKGVLSALETGNFYGVKGWVAVDENWLKALKVEKDVYSIEMTNDADSINLYGDHGKLLTSVVDSHYVSYQIKPEDSYVRAEVITSRNKPWGWNKQWFNPVIRHDSEFIKHTTYPTVNWALSVLYWLMIAGVQFGLYKVFRKLVSKKHP